MGATCSDGNIYDNVAFKPNSNNNNDKAHMKTDCGETNLLGRDTPGAQGHDPHTSIPLSGSHALLDFFDHPLLTQDDALSVLSVPSVFRAPSPLGDDTTVHPDADDVKKGQTMKDALTGERSVSPAPNMKVRFEERGARGALMHTTDSTYMVLLPQRETAPEDSGNVEHKSFFLSFRSDGNPAAVTVSKSTAAAMDDPAEHSPPCISSGSLMRNCSSSSSLCLHPFDHSSRSSSLNRDGTACANPPFFSSPPPNHPAEGSGVAMLNTALARERATRQGESPRRRGSSAIYPLLSPDVEPRSTHVNGVNAENEKLYQQEDTFQRDLLMKTAMSGRAWGKEMEEQARDALLCFYADTPVRMSQMHQKLSPERAKVIADSGRELDGSSHATFFRDTSVSRVSDFREKLSTHTVSSPSCALYGGVGATEENLAPNAATFSKPKRASGPRLSPSLNEHWTQRRQLSPFAERRESTVVALCTAGRFGNAAREHHPYMNESEPNAMGAPMNHREETFASSYFVVPKTLENGRFETAGKQRKSRIQSSVLWSPGKGYYEGLLRFSSMTPTRVASFCAPHRQDSTAPLHRDSGSPPPVMLSAAARGWSGGKEGGETNYCDWVSAPASSVSRRPSLLSSRHLYSPAAETAWRMTATTSARSSDATTRMVKDDCQVIQPKLLRHLCPWCEKPYEWSDICAVALQPHDDLRRRRKEEKRVKKRAQGLLRRGRVQEAVSELRSAGIV